MATKREKTGFTIAGILIGAAINVGRKYNKAKKVGKEYSFIDGVLDGAIGGTVGGVAGRLGAEVFGSPNDTVNYQLFDKRKHVYDGISNKNRVNTRMSEHNASGKQFTRFSFDDPKPRVEALNLERELIMQRRGKYNIQHNT